MNPQDPYVIDMKRMLAAGRAWLRDNPDATVDDPHLGDVMDRATKTGSSGAQQMVVKNQLRREFSGRSRQ